ncbi:MAG: hypothetical protein R3331_02620 [Sulfurospirillaceae bacterium]|nr:hypothetical protein [Sulfurospirillaceae bacterium]
MKSCTFELIVNILTYAIKNQGTAFSQKDFKNVVYTKEFNNLDINAKIADGCEYLLKRGFLQIQNTKLMYYEKYKLPETILVNTENYTKVFKELSKRIILMHEGKEMINDTYEVKDDYADIIDAVDMINSDFFSREDAEEMRVTVSKILVSLNVESKAHYSLLTIIQLLELKSAMKIKIKTKDCEFAASNIKFYKLQFNDDTIVLHFDKCSFEIDGIEDILHIDSIDDMPLDEHIKKSLEILSSYPKNEARAFIEFLNKYSS